MKKLIIATAVATVCTMPFSVMAGTTLYGHLSYSFNSVDDDRVDGKDGLSGQDNVSLLGVKGTYGEDIKAFFHLQTGAKADGGDGHAFDQRFFFGGLKGDFGKVSYGRMTNAYKMPGFKLDPFYNLSHIAPSGSFSRGGATYGLSGATNGFTDNALQYETPSMAGVKLTGGLYMDDSDEDDHGYGAGISFTGVEGLDVGVVFASNAKTVATVPNVMADGEAIRGYASYKIDNIKCGLSYENVDVTPDLDINYLYVTGTLAIPEANTDISLSFGSVDAGSAEGVGGNAGVFYHITEKTKIFGIVSMASLDDIDGDEANGDTDANPRVISIGATHKFSMTSN